MEEILASIRRIIADDDTTKTVPRAEAPPPPSAQPAQPEPPPPPRPPVAPPRMVAPAPSPPEVEPKIVPPPMPAPANSAPMVAAAPPAADDASVDILDLTESMTASMRSDPAPAPQFRTIDGSSDLSFDEEPEAPELPAASEHGGNERADLMSRATSAAVDSAFNTLAQTVLVQNARTLEDLVREMLRPMLKSWLDDNLPSMVERLIRAEIERVSRGR